ncbi:MAG: methionyl-tRNA formyltransferase [Saprospiraceae bacterium]|nr:methionyl-tRNA formyltransferase [Saprospiraceae bacterium]
MGTPEFAVPSLAILLENGYDVAGVVTATDKYGGRGNKVLLESAVKKYAVEQGIKVLQPTKLRDPAFLEALAALKADLQIVVAFRMLPELVWGMPSKGTFNLHGSLLPKYRGAAPINWAVIRGEETTGVTTFFIQHKIDTGDIILQRELPIGPDDTAGDVHDKMMQLGAEAVLETVQLIEKGGIELQVQDHSAATKAPKLFKETCEINFNQTSEEVHNFIRGLSPYPSAWTTLDGKQLKILKSELVMTMDMPTSPPGTFSSDNKSYIQVSTVNGYINLLELQLQGRKRMKVKDFLNGYTFE